jgi:excisionase family DNA binding protein
MELTTKQVAERLGVGQPRVRQLVLAGRIKARHLTPRILLIDEKELDKVKDRKPGRPWPKKAKVKRGNNRN